MPMTSALRGSEKRLESVNVVIYSFYVTSINISVVIKVTETGRV